MGTTTLTVLRERLKRYFGDYLSLSASSNGNAGGTTIVDTGLANYAEGDDAFPGWWVLITSGSASGESRRIKGSGGYTSSSTTITVSEAFSTQILSAVTFELSENKPEDYHDSTNRGIEQLHPMLFLPIVDESLVVDNLLSNSLMETFSGGFTGWTEVGSPTVTQETTIVFHQSGAAKVVASGADGQMTQAPTITTAEHLGETVFLRAWVYATAGSTARLRLDWGGSSFENSSYHTGVDEWQELEVSAAIPESATQVKAILEVADGGTAYFDFCRMYINPIHRYTMPSTIIGEPHFLTMQYNEDDPKGTFFDVLAWGPIPGRLLRVEGKGYLSRPTTEAGTTEVDGARVDLIVARAAIHMADILLGGTQSADEIRRLEGISDRAARNFLTLSQQSGIAMQMPSAQRRRAWHTDETSSGKVIVFDSARSVVTVGF